MKRHRTLQENYTAQRIAEAQERRLLAEVVVLADLLLEQDEKTPDELIASLKEDLSKLAAVQPPIGGIKAALDKAIARLDAGQNDKQKKKLIVHVTAFKELLSTGFGQIPGIYKKYKNQDLPDTGNESLSQSVGEAEQAAVLDDLKKAFSPTGQSAGKGIIASIISFFSKLGKEPDFATAEDLSKAVMDSPVSSIRAYMQATSAAAPSTEQSKDIEAVAKDIGIEVKPDMQPVAAGRVVTTPQQLVVTMAAAQAAKKSGGDASKVDAAVATVAEKPDAATDQFIDFIAKESKQNKDDVKKIISALLTANLIRSNFSIKESSARFSRQKLLFGDVVAARHKLHEARASGARWIDLLLEVEPTLTGTKVGMSPAQQSAALEKTVAAGPLTQQTQATTAVQKQVDVKEIIDFIDNLIKKTSEQQADSAYTEKLVKIIKILKDFIDVIEAAPAAETIKKSARKINVDLGSHMASVNNAKRQGNTYSYSGITAQLKNLLPLITDVSQAPGENDDLKNGVQSLKDQIKKIQNDEKTTIVSNAVDKPVDPKFQQIINKIKDGLTGIDDKVIAAVLAAIPKFFLLGENRLRRSMIQL